MEKTKFGFGQLTSKTPSWASWLFRIVFILTTVAAFIISGDPQINDMIKVRVLLYLKGVDMLIYGFSKLFGVEVQNDKDEESPANN